MNEQMKAVVKSGDRISLQMVERPISARPGYLLIKMDYAAINSGDKFFLKYPPPPGGAKSRHQILGVSGAGLVIESGEGVPHEYSGKNVAFYRGLVPGDAVVGTWSEYAHLPYLDCMILPENTGIAEYAGSMVNSITPLAFLQQVKSQGHKAIVSTAGNSATGIALLGLCLKYDYPLISLVRNAASKQALLDLGALNVIDQSDPGFANDLAEQANTLTATAVFDGVGGELLSKILPLIPNGSTVYSYGYLGDAVPLTVHTSLLAVKNLTILPFSNLKSETVTNHDALAKGLKDLAALAHLPHFRTKVGKLFALTEFEQALSFKSSDGGKPVLTF